MNTGTASSLLVLSLLVILPAACNGTGTDQSSNPDADAMIFSKKPAATEDVIDPAVGAKLVPAEAVPKVPAAADRAVSSCRKFRVEDDGSSIRLAADDDAQTSETAYVATGLSDGTAIALRNTDDFSVEVWQLDPEDPTRPTRRVSYPPLQEDQGKWVGFYVMGLGCLPDDRLLVAIAYYNPQVSYALYRYDVAANRFVYLAAIDPDIRNPYKFFEVKWAGPTAAVALYYSGRTRKAAELYHNYYNHFLAFSPTYPDGIEFLRLGIDTGNVADWAIEDTTLYLHTVDGRDPADVRQATWSLDVSGVVGRR